VLFPAVAEKIIAEKRLSGKENQLREMSLAFGCAVNGDDWEEAETIYQNLERETER